METALTIAQSHKTNLDKGLVALGEFPRMLPTDFFDLSAEFCGSLRWTLMFGQ